VTDPVPNHPQLAAGVRLHWDKVRDRHVLLYPEGALVLNQTAVDVLELCDGERSLDEVAGILSERYSGADVRDDVAELLTAIAQRGLVVDAGR
jgi:pyrroloquinoline quinone biosynthesis protein D